MSEVRNRLGGERSPFLQHGATQPVAWQPWGEEAFEQARAEGKPLLLDIGAVWCHWCHVMDAESYQDPDTAALINEHFVAVKVDRDERPDVDVRYQRAVQVLTGQGGWPLTAFLTPEGDVFFGGTYFPPVDGQGRPAFRRVLTEMSRIWQEDPARPREAAREVNERLAAAARAEVAAGPVQAGMLHDTLEEFAHRFDFRYGGFGRAPKFPNAGGLDLLLDHHLDEGADWARRVVVETLDAMAHGGIHDQLGGGFHRYATDERWLIPHFEKMAYDNGPLLGTYARAAAALDRAHWGDVAVGIIGHHREVAPELVAAGGFPASQDADYGLDNDGDYWTWTLDEVAAAVAGDEDQVRALRLYFGLDEAAGAMHLNRGRHVLFRALPVTAVAKRMERDVAQVEAWLSQGRQRLKAARDHRPRPYVDETLYSGWVALVASGYLAAARHLGIPDAEAAALRALERVWQEAFQPERGFLHRAGDEFAGIYLADQAHMALALLDAHQATQQSTFLERAREVLDVMVARFRDAASGAFLDRPVAEAAPVASLDRKHASVADSPEPSGNGSAALALLRLAEGSGEAQYRELGLGVLAAFGATAPRLGTSAATYMQALAWATAPVTQVVVVADPDTDAGQALLHTALAVYRPRTVVRSLEAGAGAPASLPAELAAMVTGAAPRAYVCAGRSCAAPVTTPEALGQLLRKFHA